MCNDPNSEIPEKSQDDTEEPLKEPTVTVEKDIHGKRSRANYEKFEKVIRMNDRILVRKSTDEKDLFFKSIAISINKLPVRGKTEAKLKILTLVAQLEDKYSDAAATQSTQLMFETPTQMFQTPSIRPTDYNHIMSFSSSPSPCPSSSSATSQGFEPYGTYNSQQL